MKGKTFGILALLLVSLLSIGMASALPTVKYIKINGDTFVSGDQLVVKKGETLNIKMKMEATQDESDLVAEADILGYEYSDKESMSDTTHTFDMSENDTEYKNLQVTLPVKLSKDFYDLRIRIAGRTGDSDESLYRLTVKGERHSIAIRDVVLSPSTIKAGRAMLATVRMTNYGQSDEDGVKVKISIPALGISDSGYIDELEKDDSTTSEELFMRIPKTAEAGTYTVKAEVAYDEGYETASYETTIEITNDAATAEAASPTPKTIIAVGSQSQDMTIGEGAIYPVTISNAGTAAATYTVTVDGADDWATVKISPTATAVLQPGEAKAIYVYVSASEDASAGEHMFSVTVSSDEKQLKQIAFTSNIIEGAASGFSNVKRGLEVGLIVLVVLLVILGLIIGFNKLKGSEDEEEPTGETGQTYY